MTHEQAQHIGDMPSGAVNQAAVSIAAMADAFRRVRAFAPAPERYVLVMRPAVYSRLLPMSRHKMQPYVRKVWSTRR